MVSRLAIVGASLLLAGCASTPGAGTEQAPTASRSKQQAPPSEPQENVPAVTVNGADGAVQVQPWTYCWMPATGGGHCADGAPPDEAVELGASPDLKFSFPQPNWSFEAVFTPAGQECARQHRVDAQAVGEIGHRALPSGPAGTYDVDLLGRGPQGSVAATVRWTTPVDGPMPVPFASLAVLAHDQGAVSSFGVELVLDDLAATPQQVGATITVTSSQGASRSFDVTPLSGQCQEEGQVVLTAPAERGMEAAALGSAPFTYDVDLVLDGQQHSATTTWPPPAPSDHDPAVALDFQPPLPALTP